MPRKAFNNPYCKKPLYQLNTKASKNHYIAFLKEERMILSNIVLVIKTKNLYHYMSTSVYKNKKLLILKYYEIENFDFDLLNEYKRGRAYMIQDLEKVYTLINELYNTTPKTPELNYTRNPYIYCKTHRFTPSSNAEMISHLKECDTYEYTLFGESIPKHLKVKKRT